MKPSPAAKAKKQASQSRGTISQRRSAQQLQNHWRARRWLTGDLLVPPQMFLTPVENFMKQTDHAPLEGHGLRRARFFSLSFRILLRFTCGNGTSSHRCRPFQETFSQWRLEHATNLAPIVCRVGSVIKTNRTLILKWIRDGEEITNDIAPQVMFYGVSD